MFIYPQLKVRATDQGPIDQSRLFKDTTLEINIKTDEGNLRFNEKSYKKTISENVNSGTSIFQVRTSPGDNVKYSIKGIGSASQYFEIDRNSGQVKVRRSLKEDSSKLKLYSVSTYFMRHFIYTRLLGYLEKQILFVRNKGLLSTKFLQKSFL